MQVYFNFAYNSVYDFTTARLNRYRQLQRRCISKLQFRDNDRVLCVGLGTGNEIFPILEMNGNVKIVGVDYSSNALNKAYRKAVKLGKAIDLMPMDAQRLGFPAGSFDKAICLHVMDFIVDTGGATNEILRVLKVGGQFVITYPSDKEGLRLGLKLLSDSFLNSTACGKNRIWAMSELLVQMLAGTVYLPLLLRPKKRTYSHQELEAIINGRTIGDFQIEEDPVYQDYIVYGIK